MGQDYEADNHGPEDYRDRTAARTLSLLLRLLGGRNVLLRFRRRQAHLLDDRICPGLDAAAVVRWVLFEVRQDRFSRDQAGHRVGQEASGAVASGNPDLSLVWRDK